MSKSDTKEFHILSLGAGVQSTTLYLMFLHQEITPQIDYAIFADTGEEPEAVYEHLEWLKSQGGPEILVKSKDGRRLGDDLMRGENSTGQRFASIPAFTAKVEGGNGGMLRRQCSKEYKIEVIDRAIRRDVVGLKPRQRMPKDLMIHSYIGISLDESGRAARMRRNPNLNHPWRSYHFPLIDRMMTRANCLNWLHNVGRVPHRVPRSACTFCPYHSDSEWQEIKKNPADWARAVKVDRALREPGRVVNRNTKQKLYVHRSCRPLELVQLKEYNEREMQLGFGFNIGACEGACGV